MIKILIVEDNITLRKQIKKILISKIPNSYVSEASNEKETFLEITKKRPNLVIMDIRLAEASGLNLTKKIKIRCPFIPVVINTNNDSIEYKTAANQVGADYFLSKKNNTINDLISLVNSIFLKNSESRHITDQCAKSKKDGFIKNRSKKL
jgi:DNA-binding NarL/FixJ family response regulator